MALDRIHMVAHENSERPISVTGSAGHAITIADLPPTDTRRWVAHRKATVVSAVLGGLLTIKEICDRYKLSEEEFLSWQRAFAQYGVPGLRVTKRQEHRIKYLTVGHSADGNDLVIIELEREVGVQFGMILSTDDARRLIDDLQDQV